MLDQLGAAAAGMGSASCAVVITDANVAALYAGRALDCLRQAGLAAAKIVFPAGETHKTLATCGKIFDELFAIGPPIDRDGLIVALGGGVVGDVAGFVAATALRGLRWLQCPTTLLADVDASVGGKTAVDHPAGKNLIGAFHQPSGVLIDVETLRTLPREELQSGLAECVKHGVIRDKDLLDFIEDSAAEILTCRTDVMTELVARNVAIKAAVVSADEREAGQRAHLNFGHTFGHAIECFVGYDRIRHGQAVALGMVAACRMAAARGLIEQEAAERVEGILSRLGLPTRWDGLDGEEIWRIMQHDKKVRGGAVRLVLPVMLGQVAVFGDTTAGPVRQAIAAISN